MVSKFIEATDQTRFNHGKFMIARFTPEEWAYESVIFQRWLAEEAHTEQKAAVSPHLLTSVCGWDEAHILVLDLATGEGGLFRPGGVAKADLAQHRIWVCPMFEPFLTWLYAQPLADFSKLPNAVDLGKVETALHGYRRPGVQTVNFGGETYEMVEEGPTYTVVARGSDRGIRCTRCRRTSWNVHDIENLYCGSCHRFHTPGPKSRWAAQR